LAAFFTLTAFWIKHRLLTALKLSRHEGGERDRVFVDASFSPGDGKSATGLGGIGIWIPRRRLAIALQIDARTSMEAETLALLAGALVARRLRLTRPIVFSDCRFAVKVGARHLKLNGRTSLREHLRRLLRLSAEHSAHRHIFNALAGIRGSIEWRPREENREADLASSIASRHGHMGLILSGSKNHQLALNDVLSKKSPKHSVINSRGRMRGTRAVMADEKRPAGRRALLRQAVNLIDDLSAQAA
jgi:hypothetical protein